MDAKGTLGGRQAVVAPLRCEDGLETIVPEVTVQIRPGRQEGQPLGPTIHTMNDPVPGERQNLSGGKCLEPTDGSVDVGQVLLDGRPFVRKPLDESLSVGRLTHGRFKGEVREDELFKGGRHRAPPDLPPGDEVHQRAGQLPCGHLAHIVQADVPTKPAGPLEDVREAAQLEVPLQDEDRLMA